MPKKINQKTKLFRINSSKIIIFLSIFLFTFLLFAGLTLMKKISRKAREKPSELSALLLKQNEKMEFPKKFPADLPLEEVNLIESYTRDEATKDITAVFESKKSVKENFDYYLNYGKTNGWQIDEARQVGDGVLGKILLRKDNIIITLLFETEDGQNSKITISSTSIDARAFKK